MIIRYREVNGQVERQIVQSRRFRGEARPDSHFSQKLLKAYYQQECNQTFRSTYPKSVIKKAHETAIQRFEHTGDTFRP